MNTVRCLARCMARILCLVLILLPECAIAIEVKVLALPLAGGVAGVRRADPEFIPAYQYNETSATWERKEGYVEVLRSTTYTWTPAVSSGLVLHLSNDKTKFTWGIGGHVVSLKYQDDLRIAPAITLHFGDQQRQLYGGILFTPSGDVVFPGGRNAKSVIVKESEKNSFGTRRTNSAPAFFIGLTLATVDVKDLAGTGKKSDDPEKSGEKKGTDKPRDETGSD